MIKSVLLISGKGTKPHAEWWRLVDGARWSFCGLPLGDTPAHADWYPLNGSECKRCVKLVRKHGYLPPK